MTDNHEFQSLMLNIAAKFCDVDIRQHYFGRYILSIADDNFSLLQKINKNEIV